MHIYQNQREKGWTVQSQKWSNIKEDSHQAYRQSTLYHPYLYSLQNTTFIQEAQHCCIIEKMLNATNFFFFYFNPRAMLGALLALLLLRSIFGHGISIHESLHFCTYL